MILENTKFGTIDIEPDKIITMPAGMLGFPGRKRFIVLERKESQPFYWYQCVDDPPLAFVMMNPYVFKPDYAIDMQPVIEEMRWDAAEETQLAIFAVVNAAKRNPEEITANLMAPIIINSKRLEAVQIVYHNSPYTHQHPIFTNE